MSAPLPIDLYLAVEIIFDEKRDGQAFGQIFGQDVGQFIGQDGGQFVGPDLVFRSDVCQLWFRIIGPPFYIFWMIYEYFFCLIFFAVF